MAENPYVASANGFAGDAASAYGAGLRFATALREAADQQQQQQQKTRQQSFSDEMEIRKQGGVPYQQPQDILPSGKASGLIPRDPKTVAAQQQGQGVDPSRIVTDAMGRKWLMPDPADKDAKANATETAGLLEKGARPVDPNGNVQQMTDVPRYRMDESGKMQDTGMFGINAPAPAGRTVTPAGGKRSYYMPTSDENAAADMRKHVAILHAEHDESGVGLPDALARTYEQTHHLPQGSLNGVKFPAAVIGNLLEHMSPAEHKENHDDWVRIATDPKSSADEKKRANDALKLDDKYYQGRKEPKESGPKAATPTQSAAIERRKKAALMVAEKNFKKAREAALTPEDRKQAEDDLSTAKQQAQDTYEEEIERFGGSTSEAAAAKSTPKAAPVAKATPRPAKLPHSGESVTIGQVRAMAKKFGDSEADAIRKAKAMGYAITQ